MTTSAALTHHRFDAFRPSGVYTVSSTLTVCVLVCVSVFALVRDRQMFKPRPTFCKAWQYGWTTADNEDQHAAHCRSHNVSFAKDDADPYSGCSWRKELAGYGFGLPLTRHGNWKSRKHSSTSRPEVQILARLHAQYFGGDVFMQALPGHGRGLSLKPALLNLQRASCYLFIRSLHELVLSCKLPGAICRVCHTRSRM